MVKLLPNILTFMRLALSVVFLLMILSSPGVEHRSIFLDGAFVLFLVAAVTDVVDGIVARRFDATSKFGRMIDPLVDKVLVCGAFICFALIGEPKLFGLSGGALAFIHWFVVVVLVVREAYVTILRHIAEAKGINFAATISGKFKMLTQSFAIGTVLIKMAHVQAAWGDYFTAATYAVMVVATAVSGLLATRRKSWQQLKSEEASHESPLPSA
ncbi:MAG: CDP-alcohol phosphatidyltransferase family protein [Sedimentisphaerales bacterium]|nr:CDP-alcohol phosphatidyltransferase family protein [Sedimentisphaerales bacterium]